MTRTLTTPHPLPQKTIGVLGGMSDQATADYYRLLNAGLNARYGGWDIGEIVIVSVNFGNIQRFIRSGDWDGAHRYLAGKIDALERAGADVILCASNTMHRVIEPIMATRATPFIHIADPTGAAIHAAGLSRVALLGTRATMQSELLHSRFKDRFDIDLMTPSDDDQATIDRIIFDELVRRDLRPESKAAYLGIVDDLRAHGAQGVILGCTEIFLLIDQSDRPDFPVFDTTALHTAAAVAFATGEG